MNMPLVKAGQIRDDGNTEYLCDNRIKRKGGKNSNCAEIIAATEDWSENM